MLINKMIKIVLLTSLIAILTACHSSNEKKIGIIVPIEHKAMDQIVAGFRETLTSVYGQPTQIKVSNAQGDLNLTRAIIQQLKDEQYDVIVPIGTDTTQMSAAIIKHQPIVSLAAAFSQKEREQRKECNIAVVNDEISAERLMQFIHLVYPNLHRLVLIHSTSNKVFPEVEAAIAAAKPLNIEIKPMMAPTLNELYSITNAIPADAQGILVLKDNMIVSGISTLSITAAKRHLPLITSDQGSVQDGAAFALGVHERTIGVEGAMLVAKVLAGSAPCSLPIVEMTHLTVFVNKAALKKEQQDFAAIVDAATKLNYTIEPVNEGNKE